FCFSYFYLFFFSSRRRHTRFSRDWSSDVCSSDLFFIQLGGHLGRAAYPAHRLHHDLDGRVRLANDHAVAGSHFAGRLGGLAVHQHPALADFVDRQRARLVEARCPQPFVESESFFHIKKAACKAAACKRWCPRPESNRYALRRGILSPLCLPVPPLGHGVELYLNNRQGAPPDSAVPPPVCFNTPWTRAYSAGVPASP